MNKPFNLAVFAATFWALKPWRSNFYNLRTVLVRSWQQQQARWTSVLFSVSLISTVSRSVSRWLHLAVIYWTMPGCVWPLWFPHDKRFNEVRSLTCVGDGCETAENNGRSRLQWLFVCVPLSLRGSKWVSRTCLDKFNNLIMESAVGW